MGLQPLPTLAESTARAKQSARLLQFSPPDGGTDLSPSGSGFGFSPASGWGVDSNGVGFNGAGFGTSSSFVGIGAGGGTGIGPGYGSGVDSGTIGGVIGAIGSIFGGSSGGTATINKNGQSQVSTFSWARLAAFLLGLLLIAGGLYLIKPVQQISINTARRIGETLAG